MQQQVAFSSKQIRAGAFEISNVGKIGNTGSVLILAHMGGGIRKVETDSFVAIGFLRGIGAEYHDQYDGYSKRK